MGESTGEERHQQQEQELQQQKNQQYKVHNHKKQNITTLPYLQELANDLNQVLHSFATTNQLPFCTVQQHNTQKNRTFNVIFNDNKSATTTIIITWQIKSSEKQPFDIRLSFQPPALGAWWPLLGQLAQVLPNDDILSSKLASVTHIEITHTLELQLERKRAIVGLLTSAEFSGPLAFLPTTAMVLRLPSFTSKSSSPKNYLARRRMDLVCSAVESLLKHCSTSIVDSSSNHNYNLFSLDGDASEDLPNDHQNDGGTRCHSSNFDERIAPLHYCCTENGRTAALEHLLKHISTTAKNHQNLLVIIVVGESELIRLKSALKRWWTKFKEKRVKIKLIRVAGVSGDETEKHLPNKTEDDENEQTILETSEVLHLLSRPLHSPIPTTSIPPTTYAEAAFLQYNIARINSILDKYISGDDYFNKVTTHSTQTELKLLTTDDEWHLVLLHWLPLATLTGQLISQLLTVDNINEQNDRENHETAAVMDVTSAAAKFDVHKVSRLLARLAHGFSVYYRNVKILRLPPPAEEASKATDTADHYHLLPLLPLIAARVHLCALVRRQLLFYLCSLFGIAAVQKM